MLFYIIFLAWQYGTTAIIFGIFYYELHEKQLHNTLKLLVAYLNISFTLNLFRCNVIKTLFYLIFN